MAKHSPEHLEELRKLGEKMRAEDPRLEAFRQRAIAEAEAEALAAAEADDSPPWEEDKDETLPSVVHDPDTNYSQVKMRVIRGQPEQFRQARKQRPYVPPPIEEADTIVNGLTGEKHQVPKGQHVLPAGPRKKTRKPAWCSICLRKLTQDEVRDLRRLKIKQPLDKLAFAHHKHDHKIQRDKRTATLPGNGQPLRKLNSKNKPVTPRKQGSKFQGMAGYDGPR